MFSSRFNRFGQKNDTNKIVRIAKSYVEFQPDTCMAISRDHGVLLIGANSIDKDSIRF